MTVGDSGERSPHPDPSEREFGTPSDDDLATLQQILIGDERAELVELRRRVDEVDVGPESVGNVLPDAIAHRGRNDRKLTKAITPTVEDAIAESVRRRPQRIADAIFPALGPAIRKAIAEALRGLMQAINKTVEQKFSVRSLKWRLESWRTGVPFTQIVLRDVLVYRVEQVFLIHSDTGLVLRHVVADDVKAMDPKLVSSMMTALQDYAKDSFAVDKRSTLEVFRVGDLDVWAEEGPMAKIAAAIQGEPPESLHATLQDALETIHLEFSRELAAFDGNDSPFEPTTALLEPCLLVQTSDSEDDQPIISRGMGIVLGLIGLALITWLVFNFLANRQWNSAIAALNDEPGVTVVDAERSGRRYSISGLRDPFATNPNLVLNSSRIDTTRVEAAWEPYLSFHPAFVERRARTILAAPDSVNFAFAEGTLRISGAAPEEWIHGLAPRSMTVPGVSALDTTGLRVVGRVDVTQLTRELETLRVQFPSDGATVTDAILPTIRDAAQKFNALRQAVPANQIATLELTGRTDNVGSEADNRALSQRRADAVLTALVGQGVPRAVVRAIGIGARAPLTATAATNFDQVNRSVSFRVVLTPTN